MFSAAAGSNKTTNFLIFGFFLSILVALLISPHILKIFLREEYFSRSWTAIDVWKFWLRLLNYDLSSIDLSKKIFVYLFLVSLPLSSISPFFLVLAWFEFEKRRIQSIRTRAEFAPLSSVREYLGRDGFKLSKNLQMKEKYSYEHVLVIGPTGSGKSQSFFFPNLYYLPKDSSIVVTDPKLELYKLSKPYYDSIGRKQVLIKLDDYRISAFWNPLSIYQRPTDMQKLCELIIKNRPGAGSPVSGGDQDFWDQAAMNVLFTLIYIVKSIPSPRQIKEYADTTKKELPYPDYFANFANIYAMASTMSFEAMIGLSMFAASLGDNSIYIRARTFSEEVAPEDTRNSMRSVLMPSLQSFLIKDVKYMTAFNEVDFRELKQKPLALFVSVAEHRVEGLEGLSAVLYRQIFDSLLDEAFLSHDTGRPVFFLLDEFANIGRLIGIAKALATIRSRKLAVAICLQSIEQLSRNYSDSEKKDMLNNLKTKIILPGLTEAESLEYFSRIAGKTTVYERSQVGGEKQVIEKDRLQPQAIRELYSGYRFDILKILFKNFPKLERFYQRKFPLFVKKIFEKHELIVFFSNKSPIKDSQARAYLDSRIVKYWKKASSRIENSAIDDDEALKKKILEAKKRFFSVEDITFLEKIGMFLYCRGSSKNIPQEKQQQAIEAFQYIYNLVGMIEYEIKDSNRIEFKFEEKKFSKKSDFVYNQLARTILSRAFTWAYENRVWIPSDSERGILPEIRSNDKSF